MHNGLRNAVAAPRLGTAASHAAVTTTGGRQTLAVVRSPLASHENTLPDLAEGRTRKAATDGSSKRHQQPAATDDDHGRQSRTTVTDDSHGRQSRTAATNSRHRRPPRTAA